MGTERGVALALSPPHTEGSGWVLLWAAANPQRSLKKIRLFLDRSFELPMGLPSSNQDPAAPWSAWASGLVCAQLCSQQHRSHQPTGSEIHHQAGDEQTVVHTLAHTHTRTHTALSAWTTKGDLRFTHRAAQNCEFLVLRSRGNFLCQLDYFLSTELGQGFRGFHS